MTTDWIEVFHQDRIAMAKMMRCNTASDVLAGYSLGQIAHQMSEIQNYERETEFLLRKFKVSENGQKDAFFYLKRAGAIQ